MNAYKKYLYSLGIICIVVWVHKKCDDSRQVFLFSSCVIRAAAYKRRLYHWSSAAELATGRRVVSRSNVATKPPEFVHIWMRQRVAFSHRPYYNTSLFTFIVFTQFVHNKIRNTIYIA